jgi:hypothetical protein
VSKNPLSPTGVLRQSADIGAFFARYSWIIIKNVIGWLFILTSVPVAGLFPGPLGLPLFLIGFALVTLPGKRSLTSRVLRGIPIKIESRQVRTGRTIAALLFPPFLPPLLAWVESRRPEVISHVETFGAVGLAAAYFLCVAVTWIGSYWLLRLTNVIIRYAPRARRRVRPWLRRHGINLLPPRAKKRGSRKPSAYASEEIIEIHPPGIRDAVTFWRRWRKVIVGSVVTGAILGWMFKPIIHRWPDVHARVMHTSFPRFLLASVMFSIFLLVFRVLSWRKIVAAFGHKLPLATAARIWSTSELARYLPGAVWQMIGRAYLVRPYGISGSTSSASQVLELTIFLLANLLIAVGGLPWYASRMSAEDAAVSHAWLWGACALTPLLLVLLYPPFFYGTINKVLRWIKKPPLESRLSGWGLVGLLAWALLGLCWQGLAIWILMCQHNALNIGFDGIVLVVSAYCLAWCAGFLAFWAPGGIGVRELVFVATLKFALPESVHHIFHTEGAFKLFLSFLSVLLRLWTVLGELILCTFAYAFDYRGALGKSDAPGRVAGDPCRNGYTVSK